MAIESIIISLPHLLMYDHHATLDPVLKVTIESNERVEQANLCALEARNITRSTLAAKKIVDKKVVEQDKEIAKLKAEIKGKKQPVEEKEETFPPFLIGAVAEGPSSWNEHIYTIDPFKRPGFSRELNKGK
jgi:hypothetical protein